MGERLNQSLSDIETQLDELKTSEAAEDADAAANVAKIGELEAKIAELEAREVLTDDDLTRIEGLKQRIADLKAGAQAEGKRKKK